MQHRKRFETYVYSTIGVLAMALIVIALNVIVRPVIHRVDLTADKSYTLSEGTKRILRSLDTPVQIRFYLSENDPATPIEFKLYAAQVEDMLNEYKLLAKGNLEIKRLDPVPDSEAEDSASVDGIDGQMVRPLEGDRIYFGLAVSCLNERATIPVLDPRRERLLEYDLTRAIAQVSRPQKTVIGVMSGLPVFGGADPAMMRMGGGGRSEPWLFVSELKADFDVREIPLTAETIDDDVKVLLVVYPRDLGEASEFAIDQFVLRGGKLIAFLDPLNMMDRGADPSNPMQAAAGSGASLERLLKAWGLSFDLNKVVADKEYYTELAGGENAQPQINASFLRVPPTAMDSNDVATSQIERLYLPFCGAFTGSPADGLKETALIRSSINADLTEKMLAQFGGAQDFKPSGKQYALAVRLDGRFKTAFPDGKPVAKEEKNADAAKGDAAKKSDSTTNRVDHALKQSTEDNVVVLFGDADMLHDQNCVRVESYFGQRVMNLISQNLTLVQNLVEQLGGDKDLIGIRSRAVTPRPFTKMRELKAAAEQRFAARIKDLQTSKSELGQKVNEPIRNAPAGQQVIYSDEERKERQDAQKKLAQVNDALRQADRDLQKDIDSLETKVKWSNILLTPAVVTLVGIALAVVKRRKTAAR